MASNLRQPIHSSVLLHCHTNYLHFSDNTVLCHRLNSSSSVSKSPLTDQHASYFMTVHDCMTCRPSLPSQFLSLVHGATFS